MDALVVGSRVHCILYGGKDGVIYAIHGEQKPETVKTILLVIQTGGNAEFDIVWENGTESLRVSEAIIHSVQWSVLPGIATADEITSMRAFAASELKRREQELVAERERFSAEVKALQTDSQYAHLEQGDDQCSGKLAAKNIRRELKRAFPDTKFSVRKRHHGCVDVAWRDGPTTREVEAITDNYLAGSFDGMVDLYKSEISPWNTVFGGSKYVDCHRSYSVEVLESAVQFVSKLRGFPAIPVRSAEPGDAYLPYEDEARQVYDYLEKKGSFREESAVQNPTGD